MGINCLPPYLLGVQLLTNPLTFVEISCCQFIKKSFTLPGLEFLLPFLSHSVAFLCTFLLVHGSSIPLAIDSRFMAKTTASCSKLYGYWLGPSTTYKSTSNIYLHHTVHCHHQIMQSAFTKWFMVSMKFFHSRIILHNRDIYVESDLSLFQLPAFTWYISLYVYEFPTLKFPENITENGQTPCPCQINWLFTSPFPFSYGKWMIGQTNYYFL